MENLWDNKEQNPNLMTLKTNLFRHVKIIMLSISIIDSISEPRTGLIKPMKFYTKRQK